MKIAQKITLCFLLLIPIELSADSVDTYNVIISQFLKGGSMKPACPTNCNLQGYTLQLYSVVNPVGGTCVIQANTLVLTPAGKSVRMSCTLKPISTTGCNQYLPTLNTVIEASGFIKLGPTFCSRNTSDPHSCTANIYLNCHI